MTHYRQNYKSDTQMVLDILQGPPPFMPREKLCVEIRIYQHLIRGYFNSFFRHGSHDSCEMISSILVLVPTIGDPVTRFPLVARCKLKTVLLTFTSLVVFSSFGGFTLFPRKRQLLIQKTHMFYGQNRQSVGEQSSEPQSQHPSSTHLNYSSLSLFIFTNPIKTSLNKKTSIIEF